MLSWKSMPLLTKPTPSTLGMRPSSFAISSTETWRYSNRADQLLVKATSTPVPAVHPSLLPEMVLKAPDTPPTVRIRSSDALASAAPAVTYGMIQSKATPNLARPVSSDLILTASLATQPTCEQVCTVVGPCKVETIRAWLVLDVAKLPRCPDHWASNSAPKTAHPACQLKPIWPPAIAPLSLPEPPRLVLLSSVAPTPCGVVNRPETKPFGPKAPNWVPAPGSPSNDAFVDVGPQP